MTKLTIEMLLELAEEIAPLPPRFKVMDPSEVVVEVSRNAVLIGRLIRHDLESLDESIKDADRHLVEKYHEPNSPCWQERAEMLTIRNVLREKLDAVERVVAATSQLLNPGAGMN